MSEQPLTRVVGSPPQPSWPSDRERLRDRLPPRVRARERWRIPEELLEQAEEDAARLAVQHPNTVPGVSGPIRRTRPVEVRKARDGPAGYPFLAEPASRRTTSLSLEAAQPGIDPQALRGSTKTILLGVLGPPAEEEETPARVAARLRGALELAPPERLVAAPERGMKHLPRERAGRELQAMVEGTRIVRRELGPDA
ncbi:MAG TPA: hypothetical protein VNJ53_05170 [Gaiellaceae bacterium]|nr:hypothetical protein [Gaiellaceae bacterium]